jgi:hypothetical protein
MVIFTGRQAAGAFTLGCKWIWYKNGMYQLLRFGWCKAAPMAFAIQWKKRLSFTFFS